MDSIVAIATASGKGGIGIIRVSGEHCDIVAQKLLHKTPRVRYAEYLNIYNTNNTILDKGIILSFKAPFSFTGEDILEFQCHGGPIILDLIMNEILKIPGVRIANPGEFTERAFLNNKIDLTQAEAICDLINATSTQAAISATNSLQGEFSNLIKSINSNLIKLRTYVEATIDFPEEAIDFIEDGKVHSELMIIESQIENVLKNATQGALLQEGIKLVIAGIPNAGKSSLLNALCQKEAAIVTDIEGTTRDVLKENINIDGLPIHIVDTAGLRNHTSDIIEKIGIDKAWNEIQQANRILFVYDTTKSDNNEQEILFQNILNKTNNQLPFTIVCNKIDIESNYTLPAVFNDYEKIFISTKSTKGLDSLKEHIKTSVGYNSTSENTFIARRRHLNALENSIVCIKQSIEYIASYNDIELAAEEMRKCQNHLNEILGNFTADNLLSEIFNTFCIGK